jgi:hypothetical protein
MRVDEPNDLNPLDTELMFRLLSLDTSRKMYPTIGLALDGDGLARVIREALGDGAMGDFEPSRADAVLAAIRERLGSAAADAVRRGAGTAFHYAFRAPHVYGDWIALLAHARWQPELWNGLTLPDDRRESFMAHFLAATDEDSFETAYAAAAAPPLSDWDLRMLSHHAFPDVDNDTSTPEILLRSLASLERHRRFWQWVVRTLTPGEIDALTASANALVTRTPQFAFIDEELRHPAALASPGGVRG